MRFVHAGCGVNALFGLQNHANSIYCSGVSLIRRDSVASGKDKSYLTYLFLPPSKLPSTPRII
ncbi:hypothetical protein EIG74_04740 [Escherichia coli O10]|nr:hypothetical protein [Escherichia coli O10]